MEINSKILEYGLITAIFFILIFVFSGDPKPEEKWEKPTIVEEEFDDNPIFTWRSEDKRGDVLKIKYRITNTNTKLWIFDVNTGEVVHEQPFDRDPNLDGTYRDFTYTWKLYRTERTIDMYAGTFQIVVGGIYEPVMIGDKLTTIIDLD